MSTQHPRSQRKLDDEFSYLKAEAKDNLRSWGENVVRDWVKRLNAFLDELESYVGEDHTPERVVLSTVAFRYEGGPLVPGWGPRLEIVLEQAAKAMKSLPPSEGSNTEPPTARAEHRRSTAGPAENRQHHRVQEVTKRFPVAEFGDVAVFEACKHLAQRIREMSGLGSDDKRLMERAFSLNEPKIQLNALKTATDRAEQQGVMQIASGLWLAARNTRAHRPAGECNVDEIVELLTIISYVHRRLDAALTEVEASVV